MPKKRKTSPSLPDAASLQSPHRKSPSPTSLKGAKFSQMPLPFLKNQDTRFGAREQKSCQPSKLTPSCPQIPRAKKCEETPMRYDAQHLPPKDERAADAYSPKRAQSARIKPFPPPPRALQRKRVRATHSTPCNADALRPSGQTSPPMRIARKNPASPAEISP